MQPVVGWGITIATLIIQKRVYFQQKLWWVRYWWLEEELSNSEVNCFGVSKQGLSFNVKS